MSNITKASVPGCRQRWGGLSLNKGSSLRGLFLAAVSSLFLTSAFAADPGLTGPATVVEDVDYDNGNGVQPTRLITNTLALKWNKGGAGNNNITSYRVFVGTRQGFGDVFPGADNVPIGKHDIAAVNDKNDSSQTITNIPTDGNILWVRLHWLDTNNNGVLKWRDYVYRDPNVHYLVSPAPGGKIPTETADGCLQVKDLTIKWGVASSLGQPGQWWVWAGTSPFTGTGDAHRNLLNSGSLPGSTREITIAANKLPSNDDAIYVTLWFDKDGPSPWKWVSADGFAYDSATAPSGAIPYTATYFGPGLPSVKAGGSTSTLPGTSGTFELFPNGQNVEFYWLYGGTAANLLEYHSAGSVIPGGSTTEVAPQGFQNFPSNGEEVILTLYWRLKGEGPDKWKCRRQTMKASSGPIITSPFPGNANVARAVLPSDHNNVSGNEVITWNPNGTSAAGWQVIVNSSGDPEDDGPGVTYRKFDIAAGDPNTPISVNMPISNIKPNGTKLYVIVRYRVPGGVGENTYDGYSSVAYDTRKLPHLIAPSSLAQCYTDSLGNEATFQWVSGGLANVSGYWLYVGRSMGTNEYYNSGRRDLTYITQTLKKFPTDGSVVWVRLWFNVPVAQDADSPIDDDTIRRWEYCDFKFTSPTVPEITDPAYGATIVGTQKTLTLDTRGVAVSGTWVRVSSSAPSGGSAKNPNPDTNVATILDNSGLLPAPASGTTTVNYTMRNLPVDGSKVYATFWYLQASAQPSVDGRWAFRTFCYTSSNDNPSPALSSPNQVPGTNNITNEINATNYEFKWTPRSTVVFGWWIYIANEFGPNDNTPSPGGNGPNKPGGKGGVGQDNVWNSGFLQPGVLANTATGLSKGKLFFRLWYLDEFTDWKFVDYELNNKGGIDLSGAGSPDAPPGS